jgi:hypothetical protein
MSQMTGAVHAPGQAMRSMVGQMQQGPGVAAMSQISGQMQQGPGGASVSQITGQIAAPGMGAHSMLDGSMRAPGQPVPPPHQPGMPGGHGVSQMGAAGMPGGHGVSQMGHGNMPGMPQTAPPPPGAQLSGMAPGAAVPGAGVSGTMQAAAPGAPGMSMAAAASPAAPGAAAAAPGATGQAMAAAASAAPAPAATLVAAAASPPSPGAALTAEAGTKAAADVLPAETKDADAEDDPVAGETPAKDADAEGADDGEKPSLWSGAKDDEELVDPDADRPDFGGADAEAAAAEDEETEEEEAEAEKVKASFKPARSIDPAYITAALMVVAVLSLGGVLWSQRAQLSKMWPGFDAVYKKLGLEAKGPGQGLRIAQSGAPRLLRIGGIETLVVKGYVSNIDTKERPVPHIKLQLVDATGAVIQESDTAPAKSSLAAGASVDYELRLELPNMAAAKSIAVNWAGE